MRKYLDVAPLYLFSGQGSAGKGLGGPPGSGLKNLTPVADQMLFMDLDPRERSHVPGPPFVAWRSDDQGLLHALPIGGDSSLYKERALQGRAAPRPAEKNQAPLHPGVD
mgnify:CR=1 FL=1